MFIILSILCPKPPMASHLRVKAKAFIMSHKAPCTLFSPLTSLISSPVYLPFAYSAPATLASLLFFKQIKIILLHLSSLPNFPLALFFGANIPPPDILLSTSPLSSFPSDITLAVWSCLITP